jgi:hypothetical protein
MKPAIHQILAGYSNGDAISNEARVWRATFRGWGHASEIYCETKRILPELRGEARDLATATPPSAPTTSPFCTCRSGPTPTCCSKPCAAARSFSTTTSHRPTFFRGYNEEIVHQLILGREHLAQLRGTADINLAVSRFNATELTEAGYQNVGVIPLIVDRSHWNGPTDRRLVAKYRDGFTNIVFVGRCAPNKRIEDLLFTLYYSQKYVNPRKPGSSMSDPSPASSATRACCAPRRWNCACNILSSPGRCAPTNCAPTIRPPTYFCA